MSTKRETTLPVRGGFLEPWEVAEHRRTGKGAASAWHDRAWKADERLWTNVHKR